MAKLCSDLMATSLCSPLSSPPAYGSGVTPSCDACFTVASLSCDSIDASPRIPLFSSSSTQLNKTATWQSHEQMSSVTVSGCGLATTSQCSSLPHFRQKNLVNVSPCRPTSRITLAKINASLLCHLCHGYLIDATAINRCLHSFCRSCILNHLRLANVCPVCKQQLSTSNPHKNLRPDRVLQRVIYKVVPGLYRNERERRRKFAAGTRNQGAACETRHPKGGRPHGLTGRWMIYSEDDNVSICLRHLSQLSITSPALADISTGLSQLHATLEEDFSNHKLNEAIGCRFMLCPALTSLHLLKKFLKLKLNLKEQSKVLLFYSGETLADEYTLLDIIYIFNWSNRVDALLIDYIIINTKPFGEKSATFGDEGRSASVMENSKNAIMRQTDSGTIWQIGGGAKAAIGLSSLPMPASFCLQFPDCGRRTKDDEPESSAIPSAYVSAEDSYMTNDLRSLVSQPSGLHDERSAAGFHFETRDSNCDEKRVCYSEGFSSAPDLRTADGNILQCRVPEVPELPSSQVTEPLYQHLSCDGETAFQGSAVPALTHTLPPPAFFLNASPLALPLAASCYGIGAYPTDGPSSFCGFHLIGLFTHAVDSSVIQLPDASCLLVNRSNSDSCRPNFTQMLSTVYTESSQCSGTRTAENRRERSPFLMRSNAEVATAAAAVDSELLPFRFCAANAECQRSPSSEVRRFLRADGNFDALPTPLLCVGSMTSNAMDVQGMATADRHFLPYLHKETSRVSHENTNNSSVLSHMEKEIVNMNVVANQEQHCAVAESLLPQTFVESTERLKDMSLRMCDSSMQDVLDDTLTLNDQFTTPRIADDTPEDDAGLIYNYNATESDATQDSYAHEASDRRSSCTYSTCSSLTSCYASFHANRMHDCSDRMSSGTSRSLWTSPASNCCADDSRTCSSKDKDSCFHSQQNSRSAGNEYANVRCCESSVSRDGHSLNGSFTFAVPFRHLCQPDTDAYYKVNNFSEDTDNDRGDHDSGNDRLPFALSLAISSEMKRHSSDALKGDCANAREGSDALVSLVRPLVSCDSASGTALSDELSAT